MLKYELMSKKLSNLLNNVEVSKLFGKSDVDIFDIADNSTKVSSGALFVAVMGTKIDGHDFIDEVIKKGALVVVGETEPVDRWLKNITYVQVKNSRKALSYISANWFGNPSKKMRIVGVTGTDGKTTTSSMLAHILRHAKRQVGVVTTVSAKIGQTEIDTGFHVTNPEPIALQKYLTDMVRNRCEYAVLEVTSHGIDQKRTAGIEFDLGVLTNITNEHLDYHKTFEKYRDTKLGFLLNCKTCVINADDDSFEYAVKKLKNNKFASYSVKNEHADLVIKKSKGKKYGKWTLIHKGKRLTFRSDLTGVNIKNLAAALLAADLLGVKPEVSVRSLKNFSLPEGRLEKIENGRGLDIVIDYAHTPNSVKNILDTYSEREGGRLIAIVSAEGERDPKKRIEIPKAAVEGCDVAILNPIDTRSEKPEEILSQMERGAKKGGGRKADKKFAETGRTNKKHVYLGILDRGEAISFVINKLAKKGDTVLILGKGHEKSMNVNGIELPWSDKEAVRLALEGKKFELNKRHV